MHSADSTTDYLSIFFRAFNDCIYTLFSADIDNFQKLCGRERGEQLDIKDGLFEFDQNYIGNSSGSKLSFGKNKEEGLQIDILLHRKGQILTLFECKYSTRPIGTTVISEVERKIKFIKASRNFTVERVLIT